jgi:hypothetical protein
MREALNEERAAPLRTPFLESQIKESARNSLTEDTAQGNTRRSKKRPAAGAVYHEGTLLNERQRREFVGAIITGFDHPFAWRLSSEQLLDPANSDRSDDDPKHSCVVFWPGCDEYPRGGPSVAGLITEITWRLLELEEQGLDCWQRHALIKDRENKYREYSDVHRDLRLFALGEKYGKRAGRKYTFEQARLLVRKVAETDSRFFLAVVALNEYDEHLPYGLADPDKMSLFVPQCGIYLDSLVAELATLIVPHPRAFSAREYRLDKKSIKKLVLAAARELPR